MAALFLTSRRQRAEGASVKSILQRQQSPLGFVSVVVLRARVDQRHLQRALPGLGPAVAEKCLVQSVDFGESFREFRLELMEKKLRPMNQPHRLSLQRGLNDGMSVAQRIDPNAAQEVEVALALRIPEIHAATALEEHALPIIGRQQ